MNSSTQSLPHVDTFLPAIDRLVDSMKSQRADRQQRRCLKQADFDALRATGYLRVGVPVESGGFFESASRSVRLLGGALRRLARGDSSVALVAAMHPAVLSYWLTTTDIQEDPRPWQQQRSEIFQGVLAGDWWGTITSEPGSGGDVARTRTQAVADSAGYRLTGQKHFGSGSGVVDYMVTTAVAANEDRPDWFFVNIRRAEWDGSQGIRLIAEWDGHGMTATQSHGFEFESYPAQRIAWPGHLADIAKRSGPFIGCLFASVIAGIIDEAMHTARNRLRRSPLGSDYERVEWARSEMEAWLVEQAWQGMLRSVERDSTDRTEILRGKTAIAELAENLLRRLCRIMGGGSYARHSPFGYWFEDVRALGFLRPPWNLAFEQLVQDSQVT